MGNVPLPCLITGHKYMGVSQHLDGSKRRTWANLDDFAFPHVRVPWASFGSLVPHTCSESIGSLTYAIYLKTSPMPVIPIWMNLKWIGPLLSQAFWQLGWCFKICCNVFPHIYLDRFPIIVFFLEGKGAGVLKSQTPMDPNTSWEGTWPSKSLQIKPDAETLPKKV